MPKVEGYLIDGTIYDEKKIKIIITALSSLRKENLARRDEVNRLKAELSQNKTLFRQCNDLKQNLVYLLSDEFKSDNDW